MNWSGAPIDWEDCTIALMKVNVWQALAVVASVTHVVIIRCVTNSTPHRANCKVDVVGMDSRALYVGWTLGDGEAVAVRRVMLILPLGLV